MCLVDGDFDGLARLDDGAGAHDPVGAGGPQVAKYAGRAGEDTIRTVAVGILLGAPWYVLNLVETGSLGLHHYFALDTPLAKGTQHTQER